MGNMGNYQVLTPEQVDAVRAFAKAHGRRWKAELRDVFWYNARIWTGPVPGMGNILHGLRNSHGPTWLDRYTLPKA